MLSVCFVAFQLTGSAAQIVYVLPNCAPKNTGNMTCYIEGMSQYATRKMAVCYDKKNPEKIIYTGPALEMQGA